MTGWSTTRMLDRSTKVVIAAALLAVALIVTLPIAFIVALFMMLFGHIIGGLILIGATVLAAGAAVALAAVSGIRKLRHLRDMLTGEAGGRMSRQYLQLNSDDYDTY
jgi:NhaP-type Na+/H+ or K+/H+ antiporter